MSQKKLRSSSPKTKNTSDSNMRLLQSRDKKTEEIKVGPVQTPSRNATVEKSKSIPESKIMTPKKPPEAAFNTIIDLEEAHIMLVK